MDAHVPQRAALGGLIRLVALVKRDSAESLLFAFNLQKFEFSAVFPVDRSTHQRRRQSLICCELSGLDEPQLVELANQLMRSFVKLRK